jgi:hypothetical protein
MIRRYSNFAQVGNEYDYDQLYTHIQDSPSEIRIPVLWNLIGHSTTATPPVSSPSSILPPLSSHCASIPARKHSTPVSRMLLFQFSFTFLNFRKSETALSRGVSEYTLTGNRYLKRPWCESDIKVDNDIKQDWIQLTYVQ